MRSLCAVGAWESRRWMGLGRHGRDRFGAGRRREAFLEPSVPIESERSSALFDAFSLREPGPTSLESALVGNLGLKLTCLCDQLLDGFLRRQDADKLPLGIHFLHVLR